MCLEHTVLSFFLREHFELLVTTGIKFVNNNIYKNHNLKSTKPRFLLVKITLLPTICSIVTENGLVSSFRTIRNVFADMDSQQIDPGGVHKANSRVDSNWQSLVQ